MTQLILKIKDDSKVNFVEKLLSELDYVEIQVPKAKSSKKKPGLFEHAGMWAGRSIDADTLRKKAWKKED